MAKLAKNQADHAEIKKLADEIIAAQQSEISVMKAIRNDMRHMGGDGDQTVGIGMGMSNAATGMNMNPVHLDGAMPFDRAFIDMMVPHHEGAIAMARKELADGEHAGLRKMARDIVDAQSREIAQLKKWRNQWYGSAKVPADGQGGNMHR